MKMQREQLAKHLADRLHDAAERLKTCTRASFTDANHTLEYVMARFFNALLGWNLRNLNDEEANAPAADLADTEQRLAIQITNNGASSKITDAREKAVAHELGADFDTLIIFFLLAKAPGWPKQFTQPEDGPQIELWDIPALLTRMMGLGIKALEAARDVLDEELGAPGGSITPSGARLKAYRKALTVAFQTYHELGLSTYDGGEAPEIWKMFVPPACTLDKVVTPEAMEAAQTAEEPNNPAQDLLPLLAEEGQLRHVLLGDPGMGKSTLVQSLVVELARGAGLPAAPALNGCLPIPFILRDLVPHLKGPPEGWTWDDLCIALCTAYKRNDDTHFLLEAYKDHEAEFRREVLQNPQAFFLIDGLDEIGDARKRTAIRDLIWQGFKAHPEARWLITSRIIGYEVAEVHVISMTKPGEQLSWFDQTANTVEAWEGSMVIEITPSERRYTIARRLYLAPFDDRRQNAFTRNWFVQRNRPNLTTKLMEEIRKRGHASVRVIARVPNMLCLMAVLKVSNKELPDDRADLYEQIARAYLHDIDRAYGLNEAQGSVCPFQFEDSHRLLSLLAAHMQARRTAAGEGAEDGAIVISEPELLALLKPAVARLRAEGRVHGGSTDDSETLRDYLSHIARRSGLLLDRGSDDQGEKLYGFTHLSFMEYFAACHVLEKLVDNDNREKKERRGRFDAAAWAAAHPPGPLEVNAAALAEWAGQAAWTEVLIFLTQLRARNRDDLDTLMEDLFPALLEDAEFDVNATTPLMPYAAVDLAMRLARDRHLAVSDELTQAWRLKLWFAYAILPSPPDGEVAEDAWPIPDLLMEGAHGPPDISLLMPLAERYSGATHLWLYHWSALLNSSVLASLVPLLGHLKLLAFGRCTSFVDLAPLTGLAQLQRLFLNDCTGVSDLAPLSGLSQLQWLDLTGCAGVSDLEPLSGLSQLKTLDLIGCARVSDLAPLSGLSQLQSLYLSGCKGVSDLAPLSGLSELRVLYLQGCMGVSQAQVTELRKALPGCRVID